MASEDSRVSVIVPLHCAPAAALRCLEGLAAQGEDPAFDVIVIADAAPALAPLLAQLGGDVQVLDSERRLGLAGALRLACHHVRGDRVVVLRDAAMPAARWLAKLAEGLADPAVAIAVSATDRDPDTPALAGLAFAITAETLRATEIPPVPDELLLGTLALNLAGAGAGTTRVIATSSVSPAADPRPAAALLPATEPELTIVIPTLDAGADRVRRCRRAVAATTSVAHEIVIVDNGSPPQGYSAPVNAGIRAARSPYIVVMNDDVEPEPGWWEPLRDALDAGAAVTFPLTVDGAMRSDFAAWCFALTTETVAEFGHAPGDFFDPALVIWFQDADLLTRLRAAGRPPRLVRQSTIRHGLSQTLSDPDPDLSAWVESQLEVDRERFTVKHPHVPVQARVLSA